jgi:hypothetical protein
MQATSMSPTPADYDPEDSLQLYLLKLQMPEKKANLEEMKKVVGEGYRPITDYRVGLYTKAVHR